MNLMKPTGGFEFTPFEQAMDESVKWFIENYESVQLFRDATYQDCSGRHR